MARHLVHRRLGAIAGTAALTLAPVLIPASAADAVTAPATPASTAPKAPPITWTRCMGMQCGEFEVPLDHADPKKGTTTLSLARRPADDQKNKLGVLFINPGGPGGSSAMAVPMFAQILGRDVRRRYDIVGIDPRGVGGYDLALCEGEKGQQIPMPEQLFPWKDEHYAAFLQRDEALRAMCAKSAPKILPHMTTADVARDMDLVRAALGQDKIAYYGVSYGSYLGATYANLFPKRVKAMVIDGVLDPVAWATGRGGESATTPTTTRLRSGVGAHESLMSAIAECENVGERYCREHDDIRGDWAALSSRLREESVVLGDGTEGMSLTYDMIVGLALSAMYDPEAIPDLLTLIHEFRTVVDNPGPSAENTPTARLKAAYTKVIDRDRKNRQSRIAYDPPVPPVEEEWPPMWMPTFEGVICTETRNPTDPKAWITAGKAADRAAPGFGQLWTWSSSVCAGVPNATGAYYGPFTAAPAGGMMVMTTKHDPATPYRGARAQHALTPNSRMVTVDGWGHATLDVSGCASKLRNTYLLKGRLPAKDVTCAPDHDLFTSLD